MSYRVSLALQRCLTTWSIWYTIVEPYDKYNGFERRYIAVGVFWTVAAPFTFAVFFFAKYGEKLKKRGKAE